MSYDGSVMFPALNFYILYVGMHQIMMNFDFLDNCIFICPFAVTTFPKFSSLEVGNYVRKQENKNSNKKVIKKKESFFFFSWSLSWSTSCFLDRFLVEFLFSCFLTFLFSFINFHLPVSCGVGFNFAFL